jgi:hypothetical protein
VKGININDIGYKPIPKVACTSIKNTFFQLHVGREYNTELDFGNHIHQYWEKNYKDINQTKFRFIVIRDPIKRFLSAYSNRVCHHKELSLKSIQRSNPKIASSFNVYNPGLGQFIDGFWDYYKVNSIKHHCEPIASIINNDIKQFTNVYKLEEISKLENELSGQFNQKIVFPREQTGGKKIPVQDLNKKQMEFLLEFYKEDYILLKSYYSFDTIWSEWKKGI